MKLHAIKAEEGDCLLVESGGTDNRYMLIDGGPNKTWTDRAGSYVRSVLGSTGVLDFVVVSHVDTDHIIGILDLMAEIEHDRVNAQPQLSVQDLWHNSFAETVDTDEAKILPTMRAMIQASGPLRTQTPRLGANVLGIADGAKLRRMATKLEIPVNAAFEGANARPGPERISLGDAKITIVGPTNRNLERLRSAWLRWIEENPNAFLDPAALSNADRSIPNLSSIVMLVERDALSMLLTGDARGDHILQGLAEAGMLNSGRFHADILKVQHHGSARNADAAFFESVTADFYVISANGRHGNPDVSTLCWIAEAAKAHDRRIRILVTHDAPSLKTFLASHPPEDWGYELTVCDGDAQVIELED